MLNVSLINKHLSGIQPRDGSNLFAALRGGGGAGSMVAYDNIINGHSGTFACEFGAR